MLNFEWFGKEEQRHRHTKKRERLKINIFLPLAIEKADGAANDCKLCKAAFLTNLPPFIVSKFKNDHGYFLDHWLLQCEACKSLPKMNNYFASLKGSSRVEAAYLPVMQPQFVTVRASPPNGSSSNLQQALKQTYNLQHAPRACKQGGKLPQLL